MENLAEFGLMVSVICLGFAAALTMTKGLVVMVAVMHGRHMRRVRRVRV